MKFTITLSKLLISQRNHSLHNGFVHKGIVDQSLFLIGNDSRLIYIILFVSSGILIELIRIQSTDIRVVQKLSLLVVQRLL